MPFGVFGIGFTRAGAITPSDTVAIALPNGVLPAAIYVGGAGTLAAVLQDGDVVSFVGLNAGDILPIRAKRVNSTGTTATSLVALYMV